MLLYDVSEPLRHLLDEQEDRHASELSSNIKPSIDPAARHSVSKSQWRYAQCTYAIDQLDYVCLLMVQIASGSKVYGLTTIITI
jgi:hypothetical protein